MEAGKLVLYPQILLACTALLGMSYVHLWSLLLHLLSKVRSTATAADGAANQLLIPMSCCPTGCLQ